MQKMDWQKPISFKKSDQIGPYVSYTCPQILFPMWPASQKELPTPGAYARKKFTPNLEIPYLAV